MYIILYCEEEKNYAIFKVQMLSSIQKDVELAFVYLTAPTDIYKDENLSNN